MLCATVGERRDERDGGGAASDHDDALAGVVELLRPVLGVHELPCEALAAGEGWAVALVIAVVAGAAVQEVAGDLHGLAAVAALHLHGPARVGARPLGAQRPVPEADLLLDPVIVRGVADVVEDRGAVGDRLGALPGPEAVAQRVHVGVRADARVAEQVPGTADRIARLENRECLTGTALAQLTCRADAGEACTEDQHIEVLGCALRGHAVRCHLHAP